VTERDIGIEVFATAAPGVQGRIKNEPEDFIVEEVSLFPPPVRGKHVIARVTSRNWETHRLVERLAAWLGIPADYIKYAGIKDKRAVTTQLMSFPTRIEDVRAISLPDVTVEVLYTAAKPVYAGKLVGNRFHIVVRDVSGTRADVEAVVREIARFGYFPNFFGVQRFGVMRPVTHIVGKHLLMGDIEKAVMAYIANPVDGEPADSFEVRAMLEKTRDFAGALRTFPERFSFERRMLDVLARNPENWNEALLTLPKNLVRIFLHAYQSYLFNKILSARIGAGFPFHRVVEGDVIIPWDGGVEIQQSDGLRVTSANVDKVNRQIAAYRCAPTAAIIGTETFWARGKPGEIERKVLAEERIDEELFAVPHLPALASSGMRRVCAAPLTTFRWSYDGSSLSLDFYLPKGCYATTLLREIMKADVTHY
jgi:tRNA pseudouridine13 synthase